MRIGETIAESPRINHRLKILDPITFQTDSEPLPFIAAIHDKKSRYFEILCNSYTGINKMICWVSQ